MLSPATNRRVFDPNAGSGSMLVATFSDTERRYLEERNFAAERQERETRSLMSNRHGVCG